MSSSAFFFCRFLSFLFVTVFNLLVEPLGLFSFEGLLASTSKGIAGRESNLGRVSAEEEGGEKSNLNDKEGGEDKVAPETLG